MKVALVILSFVCLALAVEVEQNKVQKRSIGGDYLGGYYGATAGYGSPLTSSVSLGVPSITSHTHSHSTAVIDRPYPVAVATPTISTASLYPATLSSYNYGLGSYPSFSGFGDYGHLGYGRSYSGFYPSFRKYYSRSYPTIYKKSIYSSPLKYKWWWFTAEWCCLTNSQHTICHQFPRNFMFIIKRQFTKNQ